MKIAPVQFLGIQEGFLTLPAVALYNALAPFASFPRGTTLTTHSMQAAGFIAPPEQLAREEQAWEEFRNARAVGMDLALK